MLEIRLLAAISLYTCTCIRLKDLAIVLNRQINVYCPPCWRAIAYGLSWSFDEI
jgi:hypothetical protein